MGTRRSPKAHGFIRRGLLLSLFLHAQLIVPVILLAFWLGNRDNNEVELNFESVRDEELPAELPPIDKPPAPRAPEHKPPVLAQQEPEPVPLPEQMPPTPKPEAPKPEEKPPEQRQVVPPKPEKLNQKIVDLDLGKEVEPPKDAKYLAQKNNRVEQETRGKDTNLDREQQGEQAKPSDDENKTAHLEEREAEPGQKARQAFAPEPLVPRAPPPTLSMRSPGEDQAPLERSPDGLRAIDDDLHGDGGPRRRAAGAPRLRLSRQQYETVFGNDAEAAAAIAKQERSKRKGTAAERRAKVLAALENFIPEVKPGNQTALNTRAAPFAQFITHMHRQIHVHWAFGFLADMDSRSPNLPMNDPKLVTKLEIVLDSEGNVDKVALVRASGLTSYDMAAIDTVYASAPYPTPPTAILSGNRKVYIHWTFHRNEEACGTPGVEYFILDNARPDGKRNPLARRRAAG